jgi:hypothetical protein
LVVLFERLGCGAAAATLHGALSQRFGTNSFVPELPDTVARVRDALGRGMFEAACRRGAAMGLHETADYALDQVRAALGALAQGRT